MLPSAIACTGKRTGGTGRDSSSSRTEGPGEREADRTVCASRPPDGPRSARRRLGRAMRSCHLPTAGTRAPPRASAEGPASHRVCRPATQLPTKSSHEECHKSDAEQGDKTGSRRPMRCSADRSAPVNRASPGDSHQRLPILDCGPEEMGYRAQEEGEQHEEGKSDEHDQCCGRNA